MGKWKNRKTPIQRLMNKVTKTDTCWIWTGAITDSGHGLMGLEIDGKWVTRGVHRISYEFYKGEIPPGLLVRHLCHNPTCVNPEHLEVGTAKDNMEDNITNHGKKVKYWKTIDNDRREIYEKKQLMKKLNSG